MIADMDDLIGSEQVDLVYNYCNFSRQNFPPEFMIGHTQSADPRFPNMVRTTLSTTPIHERWTFSFKVQDSVILGRSIPTECRL